MARVIVLLLIAATQVVTTFTAEKPVDKKGKCPPSHAAKPHKYEKPRTPRSKCKSANHLGSKTHSSDSGYVDIEMGHQKPKKPYSEDPESPHDEDRN